MSKQDGVDLHPSRHAEALAKRRAEFEDALSELIGLVRRHQTEREPEYRTIAAKDVRDAREKVLRLYERELER